MDIKQFEELMAKDYDYHKEGVDDGLIKGILLMRKYVPNASIEGADHDVIYGIDCQRLIDAGITSQDVEQLLFMGWHVNDEYLQKYV